MMKNPSHPGPLLKDEIVASNMMLKTAGSWLGVSPRYLGLVLAGERPVTARMAVGIEACLGGSAECWLRMQAAYDIVQVRRGFRKGSVLGRANAPQRHKPA